MLLLLQPWLNFSDRIFRHLGEVIRLQFRGMKQLKCFRNLALAFFIGFTASPAVGQVLRNDFTASNAQAELDDSKLQGEFVFVRLQYDSRFGSRGGFGGFDSWATDFPASDKNFLRGVSRLTNIQVEREPLVLRLDDERIFNYPFIYTLEMGRGGFFLSELEMENLREYLLRGGFLFIDDFWGTRQWETFYETFSLIFPDRELVTLSSDHEIYHCFYDVDGAQMIPRVRNPDNLPEEDVPNAFNYAMFDDDGRMMILINWNSDIGDGWEHTYHPEYPTRYANLAYQLGINYLIYSLTH